MGKDHTIYATATGIVEFKMRHNKQFVSVTEVAEEVAE